MFNLGMLFDNHNNFQLTAMDTADAKFKEDIFNPYTNFYEE